MDLSKAKVLVTGGSSGIGRETARMLVEAGAQVAICARRRAPLEEAARAVGALPVVGDVGQPEDAEAMVARVVEEFGGMDTLINNAGFGAFAPLVELKVDDFRRVMDTNVYGAMLMAQAVSAHFIPQARGNIVNVSSTAGHKGFAGGTAYAASKFALGAMTECWRAELRPHNIRVMQVNPSEVQTGFAANAGYQQALSDRKLRAEDIAHAICAMLAMNDRGFITELTVFATNPDGPPRSRP